MHKMDTNDISIMKVKVEQAVQHLAEGELDACFSLCADIEKDLQNDSLEKKAREIIYSRVELLRREMNRRMIQEIRNEKSR